MIGLELGADDYIASRSACASCRLQHQGAAALRRNSASRRREGAELPAALRRVDLGHPEPPADPRRRQPAGPLRQRRLLLLGMFLQQPGVVLDRDTISDATCGRESLPMERGIDVQIRPAAPEAG